jgi:hypothetical protein
MMAEAKTSGQTAEIKYSLAGADTLGIAGFMFNEIT